MLNKLIGVWQRFPYAVQVIIALAMGAWVFIVYSLLTAPEMEEIEEPEDDEIDWERNQN